MQRSIPMEAKLPTDVTSISMEKLSANLKLMDHKRDRFRQTILSLSSGWKDLEDNLDSAEKTFEEGGFQHNDGEYELNSTRSRVVDIKEDVKLLGNSLESRFEELQEREVKFSLYEQERIEYFGKREKLMEDMFSEISRSSEHRIKEADLREEKVESKLKLTLKVFESAHESIGRGSRELEKKESEYEFRSTELEKLQNQVDKRIEKLNYKEQQFDGRWKELLLREKNVEVLKEIYKERTEHFIVKVKELQDRTEYLIVKEKEHQDWTEDFILKKRELEERARELDLIEKLNEETIKEIELKGKELDSREKQFEGRLKEFLRREKEVEVIGKGRLDEQPQFEGLWKELLQSEKEVDAQGKGQQEELNTKEQQFEERWKSLLHKRMIVKQPVEVADEDNEMLLISGSPADIYFVITMDGKNLQVFLNECSNDHSSMCEEVHKVLGLSRDPAMLVLDAMEGFYPPHLSKGDKMFETSVVRRSCIFLLQQLGKLSTQIQSKAKERALGLAKEWKRKLNLTYCNSFEVFGLLHLLASYRIVPDYEVDHITELLDFVAEDNQVFELCGVPGFVEKVPDMIERFIEKSKYIVAVRFICKLDLVHKFPPVPLLKKYLNLWRETAHNTCQSGKNTCEAQNRAMDERVASLRAVVNCILEFNLQSEYPPSRLQNVIELMLKKKTENKVLSNNDPSDKVDLDPLVDSDSIIVTRILANMDAKNFLQFLSNHLSELELMQNDVFKVLKMSSDPGKFVIEALEKFQHSMDLPSNTKRMNKRTICTMRGFLFVLELLVGIPFQIEFPVLDTAMEIALDWKAKLSLKENRVHILAFLQLVCTYKLTSGFDPNELYNLCCSVSDCKELPKVSEILALSEKVPVSEILKVQDKMKQPASERPPMNSLARTKIPDLIRLSSNPASLLLDAMEGCYFSNMEDVKSAESAMETFVNVLKELLNVTFETYPCTQAKALSFAAVWKAKLLESTSKNQEVACFLLFLAIYKLASLFDCDELLYHLNFYDKFAINLLLHFKLDKGRPEFIKNLITKGKKIDGLICIYKFDLTNKIPPVPILKSYLTSKEEAAGKICDKDHTSEGEGISMDGELTTLRAVIKNFVDRGLIPPNEFNIRVKYLLDHSKDDGKNVPSISQSQKSEDDRKNVPSISQKSEDDEKNVPSISQSQKSEDDGKNVPSISQSQKSEGDGKNVPSISQSQKSEDKTIVVPPPPPPITDNKEEHTRSGKKRRAPFPLSHGSKRIFGSSSATSSSVCSSVQPSSAIPPLRCPSRVNVPGPIDPNSFTYCLDRTTSHLPPNTHSWQYEYGPANQTYATLGKLIQVGQNIDGASHIGGLSHAFSTSAPKPFIRKNKGVRNVSNLSASSSLAAPPRQERPRPDHKRPVVSDVCVPRPQAFVPPTSKSRRKFDTLERPISEVFRMLREENVIASLPPLNYARTGSVKFPKRHCEYHQMIGHDTDYCTTLRHKIQDLIDARVIPKPNIVANPLPRHGINNIEIE